MINHLISDNKAIIEKICKDFQVNQMYVFGSITTKEFNENSDIDFLISFSNGLSIDDYTENYFALHQKLEDIFNRNIDLLTDNSLSNPYFIDSINQSKQLIYESKN
jgi:predicted nucleotidyltransferase